MTESPSAGVVAAEGRPSARALFLVLLLAIGLRVPFLASFGIDDDEFYTLNNALTAFSEPTPGAVARYPTLFVATRLGLECFGIGPLGMRMFPFLCGIGAILLLYHTARRWFDGRVALAAAALLAIWPWHQYWSGMARYYAPLFCCGIALQDAVRRLLIDFDWRRVGEVGVLSLLAISIHPAGLLATAGLAALFLLPENRRRFGGRRLAIVAAALIAVAAVVRFSGVWANVSRVLSGEGGEGANAPQLVLSLAFNVSLPLLGLAAIGFLSLLRTRRELATYAGMSAALPVVLLFAFAACGQSVQGRYAMAGFPAMVMLAGYGAVKLADRLAGVVPRATIPLAVLTLFAPSLLSNLSDGDRHDVPTLEKTLRDSMTGDDIVFAEGHGLHGVYLFGFDRRLPAYLGSPEFPFYFGEVPPSEAQLAAFAVHGRRGWFAVPENMLAREDGDTGRFVRWLRARARVIERVGISRLDYHRNELVLLEVPGRGGS